MGTSSLADRFSSKWTLSDEWEGSPCWEWTAARYGGGYGGIRVGGKLRPAHRVSYELAVGPIPEELVIDHLCRNRACVNPDHLEVVSFRENILRGKEAARPDLQTHCKQGHEYTPENTYIHRRGRNCRACNTASARRARAGKKDQA